MIDDSKENEVKNIYNQIDDIIDMYKELVDLMRKKIIINKSPYMEEMLKNDLSILENLKSDLKFNL